MKIPVKEAIAYFNKDFKFSKKVMTMTSLAYSLEVSRKTLYNMENGTARRVDFDLVTQISNKTGYPICKLIPKI